MPHADPSGPDNHPAEPHPRVISYPPPDGHAQADAACRTLAPHRHVRRLARGVSALLIAAVLVIATANPAVAVPPASLGEVISRITTWIVRLAAGLATLFITYGAVRLLTAAGDPGAVEKARTAIRGAAYGYGLALLAPLIVSILHSFVS